MTTLNEIIDLTDEDSQDSFSENSSEGSDDGHGFPEEYEREGTVPFLQVADPLTEPTMKLPHPPVFYREGQPHVYMMPAVLSEPITPHPPPFALKNEASANRYCFEEPNGVTINGMTLVSNCDSDGSSGASVAESFIAEVDDDYGDTAAVVEKMRELYLSDTCRLLPAQPDDKVQEKLANCTHPIALYVPPEPLNKDAGPDPDLLTRYRDWWRSELKGEDVESGNKPLNLTKKGANAFASAHFSELAAMVSQDSQLDNGVEMQALQFLSSRRRISHANALGSLGSIEANSSSSFSPSTRPLLRPQDLSLSHGLAPSVSQPTLSPSLLTCESVHHRTTSVYAPVSPQPSSEQEASFRSVNSPLILDSACSSGSRRARFSMKESMPPDTGMESHRVKDAHGRQYICTPNATPIDQSPLRTPLISRATSEMAPTLCPHLMSRTAGNSPTPSSINSPRTTSPNASMLGDLSRRCHSSSVTEAPFLRRQSGGQHAPIVVMSGAFDLSNSEANGSLPTLSSVDSRSRSKKRRW